MDDASPLSTAMQKSGHLACVMSFEATVCAVELDAPSAFPPPNEGLRAAVTDVNHDVTPPFYIVN